jgi:hypothetical protein
VWLLTKPRMTLTSKKKKKYNLIKKNTFWNDWKGTWQRTEKKNSLRQPHIFCFYPDRTGHIVWNEGRERSSSHSALQILPIAMLGYGMLKSLCPLSHMGCSQKQAPQEFLSGILAISEDGNLVVLDGQRNNTYIYRIKS